MIRKFIRRLMMLDPGYRKAAFLEQKVDLMRAELKAAIEAAKPIDRTDELKTAIAEVKPIDRTDELKAAIAAISGEIWSLRVLMNSYCDYVNPELALTGATVQQPNEYISVLLVGYYGGNNLGDELMLRTVLDALKEFCNLKITVMLAENPEYDSASLGNVDIIHYCRSTSDLAHLAARFDVLLVGGGALLDDVSYPWMNNHFKTLSFIVAELPRYFKARHKKVVCYGLSTNEKIVDTKYKQRLVEVISSADYFSVRDEYSRKILLDCGASFDDVDLVDDIVLANQNIFSIKRQGQDSNGCTIGVVWIGFEEYRQLFVDTLEQLLAAHPQAQVRLIPFLCDVNKADIIFYNSLLPRFSNANITVAPYTNSLDNILAEFNKCHAVINMRYHAALLCGAIGIPQVVIKLAAHPHYANKMRWCEDQFSDAARFVDTNSPATQTIAYLTEMIAKRRGKVMDPLRIIANAKRLHGIIDRVLLESRS